ncbi:MAG: GIY-YIG nuclease family protein [Candidatus Omnitrophica bacterium]|nr:GIY-YIG nuclease family protein [Candidatus Omnitrophota bacterium]MDD5660555.1 GIY-YIG nuclease family protein [Candidatus Omnitrophota bacterium]
MGQAQNLKEKILHAPDLPGVYLMRDKRGQVLYVGKANSLKKRLVSYLGRDLSSKTIALMAKVADIEFRLSADESMALLLEAGLIHEFKPRYNISLKDDKSFPFVRISKDKFPSVSIVRGKKYASGRYLGPYTDAKLLKSALKIIRHSFAYRSCGNMPKQSCIYHRINLCQAPCIGRISAKEYAKVIGNIVLILKGKNDLLIRRLTKLMQDKAKTLDFEAAASLRDQVIVLSEMPVTNGIGNRKGQLEDLKSRLGLGVLPVRIEGFDISNLSGDHAVGSMVSFYNANPDKNNYRRFRIKSFKGVDDYRMLSEVIRRRYLRLIREKKVFPDLLVIDGGKGHLLTALRVLNELNIVIPLVSIAKVKENIYGSQNLTALNFPKDSPAMNLIRKVRDEAHRFAVGYHHLLRRKGLIGNMSMTGQKEQIRDQ